MRTGLAASTVTPGRTAPNVSFTTPAIVLCADATAGTSVSNARPMPIRTQTNPRMITPLPEPSGRKVTHECDADDAAHPARARAECKDNREQSQGGRNGANGGFHS